MLILNNVLNSIGLHLQEIDLYVMKFAKYNKVVEGLRVPCNS